MLVIVGAGLVVASVLGGFLLNGGAVHTLFQPTEWLIIFGAAIGSFMIANPRKVLLGTATALRLLIRGSRHSKASYIETLGLLYSLFKLAKTKGDLALESHVEKPDESAIFSRFPTFNGDHHTREFVCDYLRLLTLGTNNAHEVEAIIDAEIEAHHHRENAVAEAITRISDAMPALGIVAAVLGVINTMGSITQPPEILGELIGGALCGTFMGVLMSYGFFAPIGQALSGIHQTETDYLGCIKACLLAHMMGYAPQVSIEFGRKTLDFDLRPSFFELEAAVGVTTPD